MQADEKEQDIGFVKQIFVDDLIISSTHGVARTLHQGKKFTEPVIVPDQPWEGQRVYTYGTVHFDQGSGLFRMWYLARLGRGHQHRAPGLNMPFGDVTLYATSKDGINWEKPNLGLHEFDGTRENNIIHYFHTPSVIVEDTASDRPWIHGPRSDPDKRYKMAGCNVDEMDYWAAYSADGIKWTDYPNNPILKYEDTITVTSDPATGDYLAFHRCPAEVRGFGRRVIFLSTSRNFKRWSTPELIFAPDYKDDTWVTEPGQRTEFYGMSGFPYDRGQFLGFLQVFKINKYNDFSLPNNAPIGEQSPDDGPIDTQLTHSRDGRDWKRFEDRSPLIPRGEPGSFDAGCILGVCNPPVIYKDEIWVYYSAINTTHGGALPPKRITIGRASWRLDGFVSLDGEPTGGVVETVPLVVPIGHLEVNADASQGSLAVELLSEIGEPLSGYEHQDCQEISSDSVRHMIRWQKHDLLPTSQPVRLRFHLKNSKLYSFRINPVV
jgi:hypothetical protein